MAAIKSGDLVVLKSGGPLLTVDTVNTDILDDSKVTGIVCAWFVGEKLERVRFDPGALEPASLQEASADKTDISPEDATGEYKVVLDEMTAAMNISAEAGKDASRLVVKRPKRASATTSETHATLPSASGLPS